MTQIEKISAREAVKKMQEYYKTTQLPKEVNLHPHGFIRDTGLFVKTALETLEHAEFLSQHFRASYNRLYLLKQHLEKQL